MKFVDEATIHIIAGKGGNGSASFRREKYIQFGGPDGGDGGDGGSVFLEGDSGLNTLVDFRHRRIYKAENGVQGKGQERYGKRGENIYVRVPLGTIVTDALNEVAMGDVTEHGQQLLVARGGRGGLGNVHFKSSTNRAPRKCTPGEPGEDIQLHLEMKVLADVGLLGFPNAGKSTLISAVSAARPKVADYPFTTLYPNLGVVRVGMDSSFVIADIPGLIEGAAEGAGLGVQFLKHLQRTSLLLHLVEIAPLDQMPPEVAVRKLQQELVNFDSSLGEKERWLVFTKKDILSQEESEEICKRVLAELNWTEPWFMISSVTHSGTDELVQSIGRALDEMKELELEQQKTWELETGNEA
ncbi:MAG: GTPase ObgE [Gammaproteobacteria bacterium]|nr:GTPase ObgE [Gammaproteobacteria bacterium]